MKKLKTFIKAHLPKVMAIQILKQILFEYLHLKKEPCFFSHNAAGEEIKIYFQC